MKTSLRIFSIIAIVVGGLAIVGAAAQPTLQDGVYSLIGGGLFLTQGILSLVFIGQQSK